MTPQDTKTIRVRTAATHLVLCFATFAVLVNLLTLEFVGWVQTVPLLIVGGSSLLIVATIVCLTRRSLLVPPVGVFAAAALCIALIWTCPLTPRTRFFAAVRRVHIGMTQEQMRATLTPFPSMRSRYWHIPLSPKAVSKTRQELQRSSFTGTLLCSPDLEDGDAALIDLQDGRVTGIAVYLD